MYRPDYVVRREENKTYPKDAFAYNLSHPGGLELGTFDGEQLVGVVRAALFKDWGINKSS